MDVRNTRTRKGIIIGASGSIGQEVAKKMSAQCSVSIASRNPDSQDLSFQPHERLTMPDMANMDQFASWLASLQEYDYVINCAGIVRDNLIGKLNLSDIRESIDVNLVSNILIINYFLPKMLLKGFGRVIVLGSIVGESGNVGQSVYAASKSGLVGLVRSAAREISGYTSRVNNVNVTVNLLEPGFVRSNMTKSVPTSILEKILARKPNQDLIEPAVIAEAAVDLLRFESPFNGAVLRANGGLTL